jgi:tRNA dimethylallyltransferase
MAESRRPVIAIFGPTASGKSAVAGALAARIPAEIVSADSMQVYRGLPILTNQPARATRLVAMWDLDHEASVGEYAELAQAALDEILDSGRTPIVAGGTALYLRAALAELGLPPAPAPGARAHFERIYDRVGPAQAHALLAGRDPLAAQRVHPNDRRRIVRALELADVGESLAPSRDRLWSEELRLPALVFGLDVPKNVLARRIQTRTREMFERGVEAEATRALASPLSTTARQVIGLREAAELPRDEAIEAIDRRTLKYAAHQRKWMRRIPGLIRLDADHSPDALAAEIERFPLSGGQEEALSGIRKGEADHTGHAV